MNSRKEDDDRLFTGYYKHFRGDVAGKHTVSIPKLYFKGRPADTAEVAGGGSSVVPSAKPCRTDGQ